jgi:hypothetical protein
VRSNLAFTNAINSVVLPHLRDARAALTEIPLDSQRLNLRFRARLTESGKTLGKDPKSEATETLMKLFKRWGLSMSLSSQRTAKIGNHFLGWSVKEQDDSESPNTDRSPAVLRRIARQSRRRQGTQNNKTTKI